jgi:hypothetical protein
MHHGPAQMHASVPAVVREILLTPGAPLAATPRHRFETAFGQDFSQIRVHTGPRAAQAAEAVNARAFTVGRHLVFGAGQFAPGTRAGDPLVVHELTHALQQESSNGGRNQGLHFDDQHGRLEQEARRSAATFGSEQTQLLLSHRANGGEQDARVPAGRLQRQGGISAASQFLSTEGGLLIQRQGAGATAPEQVVRATEVGERTRTVAVIHIVGHASPRWRSAQTPGQADALNARLSERRAESARREIERELRMLLPGRDLIFRYNYTPVDPSNEPADIILGTEARGSTETLTEAGSVGRSANERQMRRVEVRVSLHSATETNVEEEVERREPRSAATTAWSIQATGQAGVSLEAKAGGMLISLRNEKSGEIGTYLGEYGGGGPEVGVSIAQASPSWSSFETPTPMSFADFSPARFYITSFGINIGIGLQWAKFHFTSFGNHAPVPDEGIQIGGFTGGGIGAGGSMVYGSMYLTGNPPETQVVPVRTRRLQTYKSELEDSTSHRVLFATGSSQVGSAESELLAAYLSDIVSGWR